MGAATAVVQGAEAAESKRRSTVVEQYPWKSDSQGRVYYYVAASNVWGFR